MRRAAIACLLSLTACGSPPQADEPRGPDTDDSFLTGQGEASPSAAAGTNPAHVSTGPLATHWDALMVRQLSTAQGRTFRLKEFHRGEHFSISVVGVAGRMPPPQRPDRTELLLVVEGERGMVTMSGQKYRVSAGSVAVFPPGTRGEITAPKHDPLVGLLITTDAACPPGTKPYLASFERLWGDHSFASNQDTAEVLLQIPGVLTLSGHTVYGFLPVHYHPAHEEVVFMLQGKGSFGLGSSGNLVRSGSLMLVPTGSPHFFQNGEAQGSRALILHAPDIGPGDTKLIEGHPDSKVPDDLNYPGLPPQGGQAGRDG